jgi:hypothetical protein
VFFIMFFFRLSSVLRLEQQFVASLHLRLGRRHC